MAMRDNPVFIDAAGRGQATLDALFCIDIIIDLLPGNWSTLNENPGRQEASEGGSKDEAVSTGAGGGEKLRQADVKLDKGLTVRKWLRRLGVGTLFIEPCAAAGSATPCPPQHTARGRLWLSLRVDQKMGAGQLADITGQIAMAFCFLIRRRLMR